MAAATAAKKASTRSRKPKSNAGESVNAPKLTKTQQETIAKATRLGLDVDPLNFDMVALKAAVKIADAVDAFSEGDAVEIVGTDGVAFEHGALIARRGENVRMKNDLGSVEIPVYMIGSVREWVAPEPTPEAKTRRSSTPTSSEPRAPREGSGLWAALEVLKKARTPMTGADVFAKIKERKLAPGLKGKTPEATITAALNVAAARGQHGVVRPEPGRFAIQKGGK